METEKKNKRTVIYLVMFMAFALVVLGVSAYAFYVNDITFGDELPANTITAHESVFAASVDGDIAFYGTPKDIGQYSVSTSPVLTDTAVLTVDLSGTSDYETTQCSYDIVWNYTSEDKYTESDVELPHTTDKGTYPYEFSVKINDNREIDLSDFVWEDGKAVIMDDVVIASASTDKTTQIYNIVVNMYNIDAEQTNLFDRELVGKIEVVANECTTVKFDDGKAHAYYFDTTNNAYTELASVPTDGTFSSSKTMCVKGGTYSPSTGVPSGDECYIVHELDGSRVQTFAVGSNLATAIQDQGRKDAMASDGSWGIISENGFRYEGDNPNNYVCFGSEETTCPDDNLYRIIGLFETEYDADGDNVAESTGYLTKIQKNTMYGGATMAYHSNWGAATNSHYLNSEIYPILNTTWYGSLDSTYQNQIANVNWKLGAAQNAHTTMTAEDFYTQERGTEVDAGVTETEKVFKVGMLYPSDYGYAVLSDNCARTTALYSYNETSTCYGLNWLYDANTAKWTMTARINPEHSRTFLVFTDGLLGSITTNNSAAAHPTFYLNPNIKITGGTGTEADPYRISL